MVIPISIDRPKASQTLPVNENIDADFAAGVVTSNYIELRVFLDNLTVDSFSIDDLSVATGADITYSTGAATITTSNALFFADLRVGDKVTATVNTGDFASGQFIQSISPDGLTLTLDANPDAADGSQSAGETLVFTPGDIDSTLYYVRLTHTTSGNNLIVTPSVSCLDGTQVADGTVDDGSDGEVVSYADGTVKTLPTSTINLDSFLTNARVARADS